MMRSMLAGVLVAAGLLAGCKSSSQQGGGFFSHLEHDAGTTGASVAAMVNMDDYRHLAAGVILILLAIGVWSAMATRQPASEEDAG